MWPFGKVLRSSNKKPGNTQIDWISLQYEEQLQEIILLSKRKPIVLYKHSTQCSVSSVAKHRLENTWDFSKKDVSIYFLDLLRHRNISNKIVEMFGINHESPQLLIIVDGECVHAVSHFSVSVNEVAPFVKTA